MFPDNISQNIHILVVINVWKNNFGFHSTQKTQGQKHQVNNLYFKYQVCQLKLRHLYTFLQFRLLFHEPHCMCMCVCTCMSVSVSACVCVCERERAKDTSGQRAALILFDKLDLWNISCSLDAFVPEFFGCYGNQNYFFEHL